MLLYYVRNVSQYCDKNKCLIYNISILKCVLFYRKTAEQLYTIGLIINVIQRYANVE